MLHCCGTATIGEAFVSGGSMPKQQPGQGGMKFYTHIQYLSVRHLSTDCLCCKYLGVVNSNYLTAFVTTCFSQNFALFWSKILLYFAFILFCFIYFTVGLCKNIFSTHRSNNKGF